jgi:hypothetical protein
MITYRLATHEDNQQLITLTSASGMSGEISLRIDRKPDFFKLLAMRGETKVFVALEDETIIGSLCVSLQEVYVGKQIFPIQYIGDFKVGETYRNQGIGLNLCNEMANYVVSVNSDLAFLNVSKGNTKPVSFFKNRPHIPDFENIGVFNIHQFIGGKRRFLLPVYKIVPSAVTDELIQFLNEHYSRYQLGPVITKENLDNSEIYTLVYHKNIMGVMCVTDTMQMKQNIVTKLSWKMKWLLKFLNVFNGFFGYARMPLPNEPVPMIYIKYLAVNAHEKHLVKMLITHARNIAYNKSYSFVSIGAHEKDPLNSCFSGILKLTFHSVGMLLSIKDNRSLIEKVKNGIPFEDYSLV